MTFEIINVCDITPCTVTSRYKGFRRIYCLFLILR